MTRIDSFLSKTGKSREAFILSSLKKFYQSPLAQIDKEDLKKADEIWRAIRPSDGGKTFVCAFGGAGSGMQIRVSIFPKKNKNIFLIDEQSQTWIERIRSLSKTELSSCRFLFISKSGTTKEAIFYKDFLTKIHSQKRLSLKGKIALLSESRKSPLLQWAKKEKSQILFAESSLPGRFSFFCLNGWVLAKACGYQLSADLEKTKDLEQLNFFLQALQTQREIFFCHTDPLLNEFARYLKLCWSESLFKESAKNKPPALRNIPLSDLRHACIEELIAKKHKACFYSLGLLKSDKDNKDQERDIKRLLQKHKIPFLIVKISLNDMTRLNSLMMDFYKIIFCAGEFLKVNIYTQPFVDWLKKTRE